MELDIHSALFMARDVPRGTFLMELDIHSTLFMARDVSRGTLSIELGIHSPFSCPGCFTWNVPKELEIHSFLFIRWGGYVRSMLGRGTLKWE